jgi:hypothetical protein
MWSVIFSSSFSRVFSVFFSCAVWVPWVESSSSFQSFVVQLCLQLHATKQVTGMGYGCVDCFVPVPYEESLACHCLGCRPRIFVTLSCYGSIISLCMIYWTVLAFCSTRGSSIGQWWTWDQLFRVLTALCQSNIAHSRNSRTMVTKTLLLPQILLHASPNIYRFDFFTKSDRSSYSK